MDTKILLENGTNELEILEFTLAGNSYGINVAKIREIITYQPVTPVPNSHPSIEGIFMPRDTMITAIDLKNCLGRGEAEPKGLFIVTNFNKLDIAFHVESVLGIHRVSWRDIIKPDVTISTADESVATGIIKKDGKLIIILDFEKIVSDINPETGLKISELSELGPRTRSNVPILIAEDSPLLNKLIVDSLKTAGYDNLIHTENGQQAYDVMRDIEGNLEDAVNISNMVDVNLLLNFLVAPDNVSYKNMFYVLDRQQNEYRMYYIPWDTDMSLGTIWRDDAFVSLAGTANEYVRPADHSGGAPRELQPDYRQRSLCPGSGTLGNHVRWCGHPGGIVPVYDRPDCVSGRVLSAAISAGLNQGAADAAPFALLKTVGDFVWGMFLSGSGLDAASDPSAASPAGNASDAQAGL